MKKLFIYLMVLMWVSSCDDESTYEPAVEPVYENLLLTNNSLKFAPAAASQEIIVITKSETIDLSSDQTWCKPTLKTTSDGKSVVVNVDDNIDAPRTATVTVKAYNLTKTITVSQDVPQKVELDNWWFTIEALAGNWEYPGGDFARYHKKLDDHTLATTLSWWGPAHSGNGEDWDMEDEGNYTLLIRLKTLVSANNIIDCEVEPYTRWCIIRDNKTTYNVKTGEFNFNFLVDYSEQGWDNYPIRERAKNKRATK